MKRDIFWKEAFFTLAVFLSAFIWFLKRRCIPLFFIETNRSSFFTTTQENTCPFANLLRSLLRGRMEHVIVFFWVFPPPLIHPSMHPSSTANPGPGHHPQILNKYFQHVLIEKMKRITVFETKHSSMLVVKMCFCIVYYFQMTLRWCRNIIHSYPPSGSMTPSLKTTGLKKWPHLSQWPDTIIWMHCLFWKQNKEHH